MDPHELTLAMLLGEEIVDIKQEDGSYSAIVLKNGVSIRPSTREGIPVLEVVLTNEEKQT